MAFPTSLPTSWFGGTRSFPMYAGAVGPSTRSLPVASLPELSQSWHDSTQQRQCYRVGEDGMCLLCSPMSLALRGSPPIRWQLRTRSSSFLAAGWKGAWRSSGSRLWLASARHGHVIRQKSCASAKFSTKAKERLSRAFALLFLASGPTHPLLQPSFVRANLCTRLRIYLVCAVPGLCADQNGR